LRSSSPKRVSPLKSRRLQDTKLHSSLTSRLKKTSKRCSRTRVQSDYKVMTTEEEALEEAEVM